VWDGEDDIPLEPIQSSGLSPELIPEKDVAGVEIIDPEKDMEDLKKQRQQVLEKEAKKLKDNDLLTQMPLKSVPKNVPISAEDEMYRMEASKPMEENEEVFGNSDMADISTEQQVYWWNDKYRPRKPRFFNRVHTGFDWNKYNKSHYDHDNPPPKTVHGYKFNIFYPDLLDKTQTPQFFLSPDPSGDIDFEIIRFHAGPPYEDIAFRIVKKQWDKSHKFGYKCLYDKGILHLWFNFRHNFYKR